MTVDWPSKQLSHPVHLPHPIKHVESTLILRFSLEVNRCTFPQRMDFESIFLTYFTGPEGIIIQNITQLSTQLRSDTICVCMCVASTDLTVRLKTLTMAT